MNLNITVLIVLCVLHEVVGCAPRCALRVLFMRQTNASTMCNSSFTYVPIGHAVTSRTSHTTLVLNIFTRYHTLYANSFQCVNRFEPRTIITNEQKGLTPRKFVGW